MFRLPRSTTARWENKQWTFSGPVSERLNEWEREKEKENPGVLFIFSHLRALLESPWDPSSVTKRRPERILFIVADSWTTRTSHDCESWIASPDTWKKVKWRKFIFSWQKIEVERSVSYLKIFSPFLSYKFENNRADSKINHKILFCTSYLEFQETIFCAKIFNIRKINIRSNFYQN